jgi:hypothetical protein
MAGRHNKPRWKTTRMQAIDYEPGTASRTAPELCAPHRKPKPLLTLQRREILIILLTFLVGLAARVYRLDAAGLAEDEANKILAIRSYSHGDFTVNSEHPMLMKTLCLSSIELSRTWNKWFGEGCHLIMTEETALRLPNAIVGALTVVPLFVVAGALFEFRIAVITACLWSAGGNAIWFNRITKEDTLLVFFMLSGYAIYNCAKTRASHDLKGQELLYGLAGVAFGLMLCSKYFPHYYGLITLFYHLGAYNPRDNRPLTLRMKLIHAAAMLMTFVAFNFAVLLPSTWSYLWKYVHGDFFTHHGYVMMNHVYPNSMARTPNGSTWFFYWLYLAVKLPLPIIAAFLIGLVEIFRPGRDNAGKGRLFLRIMLIFWLLPMTFMGVKFLRYTLALIPFIYLTAAVGAVTVWRISSTALKRLEPAVLACQSWGRRRAGFPSLAVLSAFVAGAPGVVVGVLFVLWPALVTLRSLPYPALYTNLLGAGRAGYFFPHDEFYDLGARESIKYIAEHAEPGALVASEIPAVFQYYLERYGRTDLRCEILSRPGFERGQALLVSGQASPAQTDQTDPGSAFTGPARAYVLVQPGRIYFENQREIYAIESSLQIAQSSEFGGAAATRVYRIQ